MDVLAEFLPFLLLILYAVLRALRGRKASPQQPAPLPDADVDERTSPQRTDLDELARHLEALVSGRPIETATPPPPPKPQRVPEFHNAEAPVNENDSFQHQQHGFGPENPYSEESFERQPAFVRTRRSIDLAAFDPHDLKKRTPVAPPPPASRWTKHLADPKRAREAFVLQTILERPQERRR